MRTRLPVGILLLMALLAAFHRLEELLILQPHALRNLTAQVGDKPVDIVEMESGVEGKHFAVTA